MLITVSRGEESFRSYISLNLGGTLRDVDEVGLLLVLVHAVIIVRPCVRVIVLYIKRELQPHTDVMGNNSPNLILITVNLGIFASCGLY